MTSVTPPEFVLIPGAWHSPACFDKIIKLLKDNHGLKCSKVALPSTLDNPQATFKDDIDAAQRVIRSITDHGRDVIVVVHSYGGMVGNSAIKGMTDSTSTGNVVGLILIASGFTIEGLSLMAPLFNKPPPEWKINSETGYAELVVDTTQFLYHDLEPDEAKYWVSQLTTQSLKPFFEGGEYAYPGWKDVPCWYVGTIDDHALPIVVQRVQVGMARGQGAIVEHAELHSSHSPFLSMPDEVVAIFVNAVETITKSQKTKFSDKVVKPTFILHSPMSWFRYGLPLAVGRMLGWTVTGFFFVRRWWRR